MNIAVTGGIACGKSVVAACLREHGVPVCDSDAVVHTLLDRGTPEYAAVLARFGSGLAGPDGQLDRAALGGRVFAEPGERDALERILHPAVWRVCACWLEARRAEGAPLVAVVVPLLYEAGWDDRGWSRVICVAASRERQVERLLWRGLTPEEADLRIRAQWALEKKIRLADRLVLNNGTIGCVRQQVDRILNEYK